MLKLFVWFGAFQINKCIIQKVAILILKKNKRKKNIPFKQNFKKKCFDRKTSMFTLSLFSSVRRWLTILPAVLKARSMAGVPVPDIHKYFHGMYDIYGKRFSCIFLETLSSGSKFQEIQSIYPFSSSYLWLGHRRRSLSKELPHLSHVTAPRYSQARCESGLTSGVGVRRFSK